MENEEKKNLIIETLTKAYNWAKGRGWNETLVKVILGAAFGVACALFLSSCTVAYRSSSQEFTGTVVVPQEYCK